MKLSKNSRKLIYHLLLIAGAFIMLYPVLWMLSSSLKPSSEIFSNPTLLPGQPHFENYSDGWFGLPKVTFGRFFLNSFIIAFIAIVGNLISCSMAAYAFARLDFKGKKVLFAIMLATIMLPFHVTVIPQYILFNQLNWINTFLPLTVPRFFAVDAFFIFLLVQYIRGIPRELDEVAIIDGCSPFKIYWHIILPLSIPALATTAIFTFLFTWDDFFSQLLYLNDINLYTVPLGLRLFLDSRGTSSWGPMFAMSILSLIPVFALFVVAQRFFIQGISTTGMKG